MEILGVCHWVGIDGPSETDVEKVVIIRSKLHSVLEIGEDQVATPLLLTIEAESDTLDLQRVKIECHDADMIVFVLDSHWEFVIDVAGTVPGYCIIVIESLSWDIPWESLRDGIHKVNSSISLVICRPFPRFCFLGEPGSRFSGNTEVVAYVYRRFGCGVQVGREGLDGDPAARNRVVRSRAREKVEFGRIGCFLGTVDLGRTRRVDLIALLSLDNFVPRFSYGGCIGLCQLVLPKLEVIDDGAFRCSGVVEADLSLVLTVGPYAFRSCWLLRSVIFGTRLAEIGVCGFRQTGLVTVDLSASVGITLGEGCFAACRRLTTVVLPDGLGGMANKCFAGCVSLTRLVADEIGEDFSGFEGCSIAIWESSLPLSELEALSRPARRHFASRFELIGSDGTSTVEDAVETVRISSLEGARSVVSSLSARGVFGLYCLDLRGSFVKSLKAGLFRCLTWLLSFVASEELEELGGWVWQGQRELVEVDLRPARKLRLIDALAFCGTSRLSSLRFPSQLRHINLRFDESGLTTLDVSSVRCLRTFSVRLGVIERLIAPQRLRRSMIDLISTLVDVEVDGIAPGNLYALNLQRLRLGHPRLHLNKARPLELTSRAVVFSESYVGGLPYVLPSLPR